jgi:Flp pilus assembly protein TadG
VTPGRAGAPDATAQEATGAIRKVGATMRGRDIRIPAFRRRRSGSELLELGLVAFPILLTFVFGIVEFGTWFYVEHTMQAAAREGARAGCVMADRDQAETAANDAIDRVFNSSKLSQLNGFSIDEPAVDFEATGETDSQGNAIKYCTVTVKTTWDRVPDGLRPMLMIRNPEQRELKGFAAMRVEQ